MNETPQILQRLIDLGRSLVPGKETNWVQTVPGRGRNTVLRMYGALEPWFNKTWRPGEIEPQP